jgi:hypothetical protein
VGELVGDQLVARTVAGAQLAGGEVHVRVLGKRPRADRRRGGGSGVEWTSEKSALKAAAKRATAWLPNDAWDPPEAAGWCP